MAPSLHTLAFIDGLGGGEMVMIFFVILLLFGGQRLPELARSLGKSIREFKKATAGVESEIKRALDDPPARPRRRTPPSIIEPLAIDDTLETPPPPAPPPQKPVNDVPPSDS